ncbi:hypothetical protein FRB94_000589 [Tulasnella sp. JGI-2019a]|nr:hypothetical protein FRB94_000589 [Tulasnella sp. JGI-2019a]
MRVTTDGKTQEEIDLHHHPMGTLPFIAVDLLPNPGTQRPGHALCHDIESLFWVLLWTTLTFSGMSQPTEWMIQALKHLNNSNAVTVRHSKQFLLMEPDLIRIEGKYAGATVLLQAYAKICKSSSFTTFEAVNEIFQDFKHGRLDPTKEGHKPERLDSPTLGPSQRKRGAENPRDDSPDSKRYKGG